MRKLIRFLLYWLGRYSLSGWPESMAKRKCTQCGERQPKEQMLVRGLVAFCNSECEAQHRNKASKAARPKKSKAKQNITAGKETIVSNKIR